MSEIYGKIDHAIAGLSQIKMDRREKMRIFSTQELTANGPQLFWHWMIGSEGLDDFEASGGFISLLQAIQDARSFAPDALIEVEV